MVTADGQIQFTIQPNSLMSGIDVRMRRFGERWVAEAGTESPNIGVALSARAALKAALAPLGERQVTVLLADLSLLEPSCDIVELGRTTAS